VAEPTAVAAAFKSPWTAAAFCGAIAALIALPAVFSALGLYGRRDAYMEMTVGDGSFPFAAKEALDERSDVDILLLGDSTLWLGVNALLVQEELSRSEGRPANVMTFGHNWQGIDLDYALLRDTLAHRRVKTLALSIPAPIDRAQARPHHYAYHFLPFGVDPAMVSGLALDHRLTLYAESVLGAPRHLVSLIRRNPDVDQPIRATRGSHPVEEGFEGAPYEPLGRDPPALPADRMIAARSPESFRFTGQPLTDYQAHFVKLIAGLLREHGVRLVTFHVPRWAERASPVDEERLDWPRAFGIAGSIIGVPPAVLFEGLTDDEITRLYCNQHLNADGARFFTRAITPALLEVHHHGPEPR
jgi:hypothetical protein